MLTTKNIRNIAIIAHVDHGKTTLVDAFLKQTATFRANEDKMNETTILDNNELERERGITILAKNTSVFYKDYKINIIDTPGHSDFGGEVERVLSMASGAILLVDAQEGTMPQTKFVLRNALKLGLKVIVLVNKIDKKFANVDKTVDKIHDLFLELASSDDQLNFPVMYSISREGKVFREMPKYTENSNGEKVFPDATIEPILEEIIKYIPAPIDRSDGEFQMQITNIDYDAHLGNMVIGRVTRGVAKINDPIVSISSTGEKIQGRITKLYTTNGLKRDSIEQTVCGDIIALSGIKDAKVGSTICSIKEIEALPDIEISEPSLKIKFEPNTSPFAGKVGKFVTSRQILERLQKEMLTNVAMKLEVNGESEFVISGRGELHIAILIEKLRREGYEFQVSKPEVILKKINDKICEPQEILYIDVPQEYIGAVTTELASRKAEMLTMDLDDPITARLSYKIRTKALLGLRSSLMTQTKGTAIINSFFDSYVEYVKDAEKTRKGVLISMETGKVFNYAIEFMQERGSLFVKSQDDVYEGMIVGINKFDNDMEVNPCRQKHSTGVRVAHIEKDVSLTPPIEMTLDFALTFIEKDELLEVTPDTLRLRKKFLTKTQRSISERSNLSNAAKIALNS